MRKIEAAVLSEGRLGSAEIQTEFLRKTIHFMIALVPTLAAFNLEFTRILLGSGIMVYTFAEFMRLNGRRVVLITRLTVGAARERDQGRFVLGPVTLGIGAMLALMLYPAPAAAIGIYALAFGDGLASLVGKLIPYGKIPYMEGKTLSGSMACFVAVYLSAFVVTGRIEMAFFLALLTTFLEVLPSKDLDNIIIPVGTGLAATLMLGYPL